MKSRLARNIVAVLVLVVTLAAGSFFLQQHPTIMQQIFKTPPITLTGLLGLYLLFMISLWQIFRSSLMLCDITLPKTETLLVSAYSSIINFFGPLQSGPAFRALYLKRSHSLGVGKYALASLVYYFFYAFYSGLFLVTGALGWWVILLAIVGLGVMYGLLHLPIKILRQLKIFKWQGLVYTALATLLQVSTLAAIFYVELHSINHAVSLSQALIYTGAANFALFVSITPAAIGFRESFVLLSRHLHHIPNATAVGASLIDRGVYVVTLLLLAVFIFGTQARARLKRLTS